MSFYRLDKLFHAFKGVTDSLAQEKNAVAIQQYYFHTMKRFMDRWKQFHRQSAKKIRLTSAETNKLNLKKLRRMFNKWKQFRQMDVKK